ncbi:unnamed protein product [Phytophthora fragariaefolia]|uniref:Unnamed protein product n=1 Tax=Phytophthora fragariaefolia TaxID=1490495 RepID=A0A9W6YFU6_9STRA|nr:unnamed protein product [Phytophthora fragariaefolia]
MARSLPNLLKTDAEWCSNAEHQDAFEAIKVSLLHAPILASSDPDRPFSVVCDASDFSIGCALLQADAKGRERVIAFESRQLKAAEKNYPVHDKELLAMKYVLVKVRVHLLGSTLGDKLDRPPTLGVVSRSFLRVSRRYLDMFEPLLVVIRDLC